MRLFHFSDDPTIEVFTPQPVEVPSPRPIGREWLNGPLVWAIDEPHQPLYLFPRDCPRILLWRLPETTAQDVRRWLGDSAARMVAYVEAGWMERVREARICRYELPPEGFEDLQDAGMWISRKPVRPLGMEVLDDLPAALAQAGVELRVLPGLSPLRGAWTSSLHASGLRLRNARDWDDGIA